MSAEHLNDPVAYLLGEMSAEQAAAFEARLRQEPELAREVDRLGPVVTRLQQQPQTAWDVPEPPPLLIPDDAATATVKPPRPTREPAWGWPRLALGFAFGLVLLAVGFGLGQWVSGDGGTPGGDPASSLALEPFGEGGPQAAGQVLIGDDAAGQALRLDVSGLRPTDENEFYEFWLIGEQGELVALGSFRVDEQGRAEVDLPLPVDPGRFQFFDLSVQEQSAGPEHSGRSVLRGPTPSQT